MLKIAFYLDSVDQDTGCLRVIPGSHLEGLGERLREQGLIDDPMASPYADDVELPALIEASSDRESLLSVI